MPGSRDSETLLDWVSHARARFARRRTEKPATKAGQIRALWPDIEAALEGGQSMKSIRKWLEEDAGSHSWAYQPHFVHQPHPSPFGSQTWCRSCDRAISTTSNPIGTSRAFVSCDPGSCERRA